MRQPSRSHPVPNYEQRRTEPPWRRVQVTGGVWQQVARVHPALALALLHNRRGAKKSQEHAGHGQALWCVEANDATDLLRSAMLGSSEGNGAPRMKPS